MPKEYSRSRRVEEQVKRELAVAIQSEIDTTNLGMVTITAVEISRDLKQAKVFYTSLGAKLAQNDTTQMLNDACPQLRHWLSQNMSLRAVPHLKFLYDVSIERGMKMSALLDDISQDETDE